MASTVYGLADNAASYTSNKCSMYILIKHVPSWHLLFMVWLRV